MQNSKIKIYIWYYIKTNEVTKVFQQRKIIWIHFYRLLMWLWLVIEVIELVSGIPASQFGEESRIRADSRLKPLMCLVLVDVRCFTPGWRALRCNVKIRSLATFVIVRAPAVAESLRVSTSHPPSSRVALFPATAATRKVRTTCSVTVPNLLTVSI
jgi:hypothetical protein